MKFFAGVILIALYYLFPAAPKKVTMATIFAEEQYLNWAQRYREKFASAGVELELRKTNGAVENLKLLQEQHSDVQIGWGLGGTASEPPKDVLSLGVIDSSYFLLYYLAPESLNSLEQFKGKRIAIGPVGSAVQINGVKVFSAADLTAENTTFLPMVGSVATEALREGKVDAVLALLRSVSSNQTKSMLEIPNVRIFNFEGTKALTRLYPQFSQAEVPMGLLNFKRKIPEHDITVLAVGNHVLIRSDLHPTIVDILLKTMSEEHSGATSLHGRGEFPNANDAAFQMAPAAIDFYRDGPSLVHRLFPLWMTVHVQRAIALFLATIPFLLFVISYEPLLYRWIIRERVRPFYHRLKGIERQLPNELTVEQLVYLAEELEEIDREAIPLKIPLRHSDSFFSLKVHINLIRTRLGARLAEARAKLKRVRELT